MTYFNNDFLEKVLKINDFDEKKKLAKTFNCYAKL